MMGGPIKLDLDEIYVPAYQMWVWPGKTETTKCELVVSEQEEKIVKMSDELDEWCLICHKVTKFLPVAPRMAGIHGRRQAIPGLWYCEECGIVVFCEEQISEEEKKAARERAELLEGFD